MTAKRILVSGGNGFVGRAVVEILAATGAEPITLGRQVNADVTVDLTDPDQVQSVVGELSISAVCHLAARTSGHESISDPLGYWSANVAGTINLLAAIAPGTPLVLASSGAVYAGDVSGALDEDTPVRPGNPYGGSKFAAEELARAWSAATESPLTVLRCFNIAGAVAGQGDPDQTRVIPAIINAGAGRTDGFTVNGDGSTTRDYCHVLDVADAFAQAIDKPTPGSRVFNVGTGDGLSISQLLDAAQEVIGHDVPVHSAPARAEAARLVADSRRILTELDWVPTRSTAKRLIQDAWDAR